MNNVPMPIPLESVQSSQIAAIGHDPETNTLAVRFASKGGRAGALYYYDNVDAETFESFRTADSIGSYFYKHIKPHKDRYPYKRIIEQPVAEEQTA